MADDTGGALDAPKSPDPPKPREPDRDAEVSQSADRNVDSRIDDWSRRSTDHSLERKIDDGSARSLDHALDRKIDDGTSQSARDADLESARTDVAKAHEVADAQAGVDAVYAEAEAKGEPLNTQKSYEAAVDTSLTESRESTPGVKEVEFQEPAPPKQVEFQEPAPPKEAEFQKPAQPRAIETHEPGPERTLEAPGGDRLQETHDPAEQQVVDSAKAELANREANGEVIGGSPAERANQWHEQGDNGLGYQNDCGVAAAAGTLRECGVETSENELVDQAAENGLCRTDKTPASENGGTSGESIGELLSANGVENLMVNPQTADELAAYVDQGHGVITEVNSAELWSDRHEVPAHEYSYDLDDHARVDHAVQVTGTVRDENGSLTGFVVNDSGVPDGAGTVVPIDRWDASWTNTDNDHETIVTLLPTQAERNRR